LASLLFLSNSNFIAIILWHIDNGLQEERLRSYGGCSNEGKWRHAEWGLVSCSGLVHQFMRMPVCGCRDEKFFAPTVNYAVGCVVCTHHRGANTSVLPYARSVHQFTRMWVCDCRDVACNVSTGAISNGVR
jgi:hypothetical protein